MKDLYFISSLLPDFGYISLWMIAIICTSLIAILAPRDSLEKTLLPLDHELLHIHMAHLQRYYHKAAALMEVHQNYEPVFFFSILRSRCTDNLAGEDFVKFSDRSDKLVESSGNPSTYWRQGRTNCLKLASPRKIPRNWRIF
jgi:hypothetical protein